MKIKNTNHLFTAVCQVCGCTKEEILSSSRLRHIVIARKIVTSYLPNHTEAAVGSIINRDHATVNYYRKMHEYNLKSDALFREKMAKMYFISKVLHL